MFLLSEKQATCGFKVDSLCIVAIFINFENHIKMFTEDKQCVLIKFISNLKCDFILFIYIVSNIKIHLPYFQKHLSLL